MWVFTGDRHNPCHEHCSTLTALCLIRTKSQKSIPVKSDYALAKFKRPTLLLNQECNGIRWYNALKIAFQWGVQSICGTPVLKFHLSWTTCNGALWEHSKCHGIRLAKRPKRQLHPNSIHTRKINIHALWLMAACMYTSASVLHSTFRPRFSSLSERLISWVRMFMRSHSCRATTTYGLLSSTFPISAVKLNSSGSFSSISSRTSFTFNVETLRWAHVAQFGFRFC